jgi:magnesium-transporting ATPase (P-type)
MPAADKKINWRRLAAWAGIFGTVLFVTIFTAEGWLRAEYNPRSMYVSELALGPRGWIQSINFMLLGLMFIVYTSGIAVEFRKSKKILVGPVLLFIIGASFLLSGFFTMDPVSTLPEQTTLHGRLHDLFGALVFTLAPISCFVFLRCFRNDLKWQPLFQWTLIAGIIIIVAVVAMSVGPAPPSATPNIFNEWVGLIQRVALITYLGWHFTLAYWLIKND